MNNVQLLQPQLDIQELNDVFNQPIWSVRTNSPKICFSITFKGEGDRKFQKQPKILDVLANVLLDGAGKRDGIALKKLLSNRSIDIHTASDSDNFTIDVSCLSKYFDITIDILCELLVKAHLKADRIEIAKQELIVSLKQSIFSPHDIAMEKLNNTIYPTGHRYRYTIKGTIESVEKYTKKDVDECYAKMFSPANAMIVIVSNLEPIVIKRGFKRILDVINTKKFADSRPSAEFEQKTAIESAGRKEHVELDNPQSSVTFALPGVPKNSKQRFAVLLANSVWGQIPLVSRLSKIVRGGGGFV
ncbi:MAG: insulinase family protein, partial [Holosporales bacterium]|nr:insulinase family protein [Holosporales bacterium]